ncbi:MAG: hypothetical protein ACOX5J_11540 [Candidatus Hydrogenedentales bacterium]
MKGKGKQPEQLGLLIIDEPHRAEQDETILHWALAIRAMDPASASGRIRSTGAT